ncbi:hypothetical protein A0257_15275 [Hymenobacter psoromatis]|nr:hypothetical protein A0257_15275 [Hymenobacter psoromatis]
MQENFLIGIGGTGSRVLEAFVHCCAAGFGPKGKVYLLLIDPDAGNGNLTRTKTLIEEYRRLRAAFKREETNAAFQTEIVIPDGDAPFVWSIFDEADQTLKKYIGYTNLRSQDGPLADVADLLFTQSELDTKLNEGFRGHPSIGAVVMADPPMNEYPFKMLKDNMPSEAGAGRVFLVGSIFGGTGAAGFPTLGADKVLKYNADLQTSLGGNRSKVLLGGALVLPYFDFAVDNTKGETMFVTPQDFPMATKAALHYYNDKQLAFDQYYFIGDSLAQKVGNFSTGTSTQENRPHYVELASALAAFDFFRQEQPKEGADKSYFIASRETPTVTWDQLPLSRYGDQLAGLRSDFRRDIGDFTLFCYTYLTVGHRHLDPANRSETKLASWYKDSFKGGDSAKDDPTHGDNRALFGLMTSYARRYLRWITDLDDRAHVQLIDSDKLLASQGADSKAVLPLKLPQEWKQNIGLLYRGQPGGRDFDYYTASVLNNSEIKDYSQHAADRYLNIFFRAAKKFNQDNAATR